MGELALDDTVRPIKSAIAVVETANQHGVPTVYVPTANTHQAQLIEGMTVIPLPNLKALFLHLRGEAKLDTISGRPEIRRDTPSSATIDDIRGQEQAKRAVLVAVAGRHNLLLSGAPGSGKTMLVQALNSLLPPLTDKEVIEVTKLHSLGGEAAEDMVYYRPFRSPHHTASRASMSVVAPKPCQTRYLWPIKELYS